MPHAVKILRTPPFLRQLRSLSAYKHSSHENVRHMVKAAMVEVDEGIMMKWRAEAVKRAAEKIPPAIAMGRRRRFPIYISCSFESHNPAGKTYRGRRVDGDMRDLAISFPLCSRN